MCICAWQKSDRQTSAVAAQKIIYRSLLRSSASLYHRIKNNSEWCKLLTGNNTGQLVSPIYKSGKVNVCIPKFAISECYVQIYSSQVQMQAFVSVNQQ